MNKASNIDVQKLKTDEASLLAQAQFDLLDAQSKLEAFCNKELGLVNNVKPSKSGLFNPNNKSKADNLEVNDHFEANFKI